MKEGADIPTIIEGGFAVDERGRLSFVNTFSFEGIKRFYQVENSPKNPIRAFHGHMNEAKYFFMAAGSGLAVAVPIDNPLEPNKKNTVHRFFLSAQKPSVLYIPPGYANGYKILEDGAVLIVFSTSTLEESKQDSYRFPHDYWGEKVWDIDYR